MLCGLRLALRFVFPISAWWLAVVVQVILPLFIGRVRLPLMAVVQSSSMAGSVSAALSVAPTATSA